SAKFILLPILALGTPTLGRAAHSGRAGSVAEAVTPSVAQALYTLSDTKQAAEITTDARIFELRRQIEELQKQGAPAAARLAGGQFRYVAELEKHARAYAQEVAVFRKALEEIASTADGEAALRLFNTGDEPGALQALDKLRGARDQARAAAAKL